MNDQMDQEEFGLICEQLRGARGLLGWSTELARKAGLSLTD